MASAGFIWADYIQESEVAIWKAGCDSLVDLVGLRLWLQRPHGKGSISTQSDGNKEQCGTVQTALKNPTIEVQKQRSAG